MKSLIGAGNKPTKTTSVRMPQVQSCTGHVKENSREEAVSAEMDRLVRNALSGETGACGSKGKEP